MDEVDADNNRILNSAGELKRARFRIGLSVFLTLIMAALFGHLSALMFGLTDLHRLERVVNGGVVPVFVLLLALSAWLLIARRLGRVQAWLKSHPETSRAPEEVLRPLMSISRDYWSFPLAYVAGVAAIMYLQGRYGVAVASAELGQFALLQLVGAIMVGIPGYLTALDILGRVVAVTGLTRPIYSLKSRLILLGGLLPLLGNAALLMYFWRFGGAVSLDTFILFGLLAGFSIAVTTLSLYALSHAITPMVSALENQKHVHPTALSDLRPRSVDEVGYFTQSLGELFQRLGDQNSHMRAIVDTAAEGIVVVDENGIIVTANPAAVRLFGYSVSELTGKPLWRVLPRVNLAQLSRNNAGREREVMGLRRDGIKIPTSLCVGLMEKSGVRMYTCLVADISERKAAEQAVREGEERYRRLVETAHDLVWSMDVAGRWLYLNKAAVDIYGHEPEHLIGKSIRRQIAPENVNLDLEAFRKVLKGRELVQYETVHLDADGRRRFLSFNATPQRDDSGRVISITGTARDITEQKENEKKLAYQAEHDSLTGLYNRHYFQEELERLVARVARSGAECSLFYIDLDQFKYVNDTLGHAAGDQLLIDSTRMLEEHIRDGDLLARFGGDEFTVLVYDISPGNALATAEKLRDVFERFRFIYKGRSINVTCSIGVTAIDNDAISGSEALAQADLACHVAKSRGRNRVYGYDPHDRDKLGMAEDMGWAARVREVLDNNRFQLAYQPILGLADGAIETYEVLIRMPYDDGQVILPGGFMPAAERFGLVHSIDRWTVVEAISQLGRHHKNGRDVSFAINLSGRAFEDAALLPLIRKALDQSGVNPKQVTFEITETAAISNLAAATRFIHALRDLGCKFALDDFGTGFCSFAYLKNLPVDKLKIDGSFVKGLADAPVDQAMVRSMNQIAHALGKVTIAEAVENAETLELLKDFGVDYAQGHFIGRPDGELLGRHCA